MNRAINPKIRGGGWLAVPAYTFRHRSLIVAVLRLLGGGRLCAGERTRGAVAPTFGGLGAWGGAGVGAGLGLDGARGGRRAGHRAPPPRRPTTDLPDRRWRARAPDGATDPGRTAMTPRTALIAAELKRIHARCPEDVAVLMAPLLQAFEATGREPLAASSPADLAAMANSLAQIAAQAGDVETAVAIASVQAEIEAITAADLATDAPAAAPAVDTLTLARRHLLSLVFGLLGAGAVSYAVYVGAQVRYPPGSLLGWLLSASTTLLAVALTLRVGAALATRMPAQRLTTISATAAALAGLVALGSVLIHRPVLDAAALDPPTAAVADATGTALAAGLASAVPGGAVAGTAAATGDAPAAAGGTGERPTISLWWLGDQVGGRPAATAVLDAERLAAAPPPTPPTVAVPARTRPRLNPTPAVRTEPAAPYAELLNRRVLLHGRDGAVHAGTLTGISKDGVTLATEVLLFGRPIQAERRFGHGAIGRIEAE